VLTLPPLRNGGFTSRAYLRAVARDPAAADDVLDPRRAVTQPCFADKTAPMYGFLDSRVGRSWAKTYAMIRERFDVRTTPGRHIVQGHLLPEIALYGKDARNRSARGTRGITSTAVQRVFR
jgi:hypothetical protein